MHEIRLDKVDSTQAYAKNHCREFPAGQITCIIAEEQTAGKGRFNRKWLSPRGVNLLATFYFLLSPNTLHLTSLAQVMTYSLAKVLLDEGFQPKIKWPNDVLLSGKKVSGVLCETIFEKEKVACFVGIGVNVNQEDMQNIDQPATSLKLETGRSWDRDELLKKLQKQFASDLEKFKQKGFDPFYYPFENLLAFRGETIRCFDGKKEWVGICHSLTNEGKLNLYLPDHTMVTLSAGNLL